MPCTHASLPSTLLSSAHKLYNVWKLVGCGNTYPCIHVGLNHNVCRLFMEFAQLTRRESVPYAALYIAPILIDTRLHSTHGQFFIRHECGACIRLRTNTSLIRMISRPAYGFGIFLITCLHKSSDERVQTLYTSCIRIVSNPFSVLHT